MPTSYFIYDSCTVLTVVWKWRLGQGVARMTKFLLVAAVTEAAAAAVAAAAGDDDGLNDFVAERMAANCVGVFREYLLPTPCHITSQIYDIYDTIFC